MYTLLLGLLVIENGYIGRGFVLTVALRGLDTSFHVTALNLLQGGLTSVVRWTCPTDGCAVWTRLINRRARGIHCLGQILGAIL